jgi:hypothetical protein
MYLGQISTIAIQKSRKVVTPKQNKIKEGSLSCKEWSSKKMIDCANELIRNATRNATCQLPMSLKIGNICRETFTYLKNKLYCIVNFFDQPH